LKDARRRVYDPGMTGLERGAAAAVSARRESWTQALIDERLNDIAHAFAVDGTPPPLVHWNPGPPAMRSPQIRFVLEHWRALSQGAAAPPVVALDPGGLRPALGYLMLVEPLDGGADFRYRLYGSLIATVSGRDMTGKLVSQYPAGTHVVDFSLAGYRAVYRRKEPLYTFRRPARAEFTRAWERLVLPFLAAGGEVGRFLVANVPSDDLGEAIRPAY